MGRGMFGAAVLGRNWYHQSRRYFPSTNTTTSMELGQRVASLVVDVALCPGLARVRDARDGKHAGSLSRAGGRSRRRFHQPSHLPPSDLCTHLPITITPRTKINAMLAIDLDVFGPVLKSCYLLREQPLLLLWWTVIAREET